MALSQRLEIRQSHALVMTPQLMQAIKLLQLSNLDLVAYVEGELERNPLLERAGEGEGEGRAPSDAARPRAPRRPAADWTEATACDKRRTAPRSALGADLDDDAARRRPTRRRRAPAPRPPPAIPNGRAPAPAAARTATTISKPSSRRRRTLADHLAEQLALAIADPARRMIGQYLIDLVDEAGYLAGDLAQVADKLGAPPAEVEAVLAILQSFDPPGVCARNLTECLAIQLRERDRFDPAMQALVEHLDLLAKRDLAGAAQGLRRRATKISPT